MSNSNNSNKFVTIVVLNDGETFTDISGCSICIIPQEDYERVIAEGGDARDFSPVVEIGLNSITLPMSYKDHIAFEDENEDENEDEAWDHGGALGQFEREEGEDN